MSHPTVEGSTESNTHSICPQFYPLEEPPLDIIGVYIYSILRSEAYTMADTCRLQKDQFRLTMLEAYFFQATGLSASIVLNTPTLSKWLSRGVKPAQ